MQTSPFCHPFISNHLQNQIHIYFCYVFYVENHHEPKFYFKPLNKSRIVNHALRLSSDVALLPRELSPEIMWPCQESPRSPSFQEVMNHLYFRPLTNEHPLLFILVFWEKRRGSSTTKSSISVSSSYSSSKLNARTPTNLDKKKIGT